MTGPELTEDALLGGRIRVRQPARGYRVNIDTLLLAAAVEASSGARLMEAGCGVGAALIAVAARTENTRFLGIERDQNIAAIARENVALNAMSSRIEIAAGDALDRDANWGVFEGVFANPPFDRDREGRAPAEARRHAHITEMSLSQWVGALADRLTGGAALTMIHRAGRTPDLLAALDGRLGGVELMPVRPHAEAAAKRVIVRARKGSRAPFRLLKGLDLHDRSGGKYTPEIEALLRGETILAWGD
jgi:tRNA1(Val) A37 N6-methylase TrmN6